MVASAFIRTENCDLVVSDVITSWNPVQWMFPTVQSVFKKREAKRWKKTNCELGLHGFSNSIGKRLFCFMCTSCTWGNSNISLLILWHCRQYWHSKEGITMRLELFSVFQVFCSCGFNFEKKKKKKPKDITRHVLLLGQLTTWYYFCCF